jgi:YD repeat-containing protein
LTVTRKRPQANQTNVSTLTTTTTQYDALGRVVNVSYNDSLTPTKQYLYDSSSWAEASSQQYLKGRLSLAETSNTGTLYSYDAMGRVNNTWQCTPSGCGNAADDKHTAYTYDWAGNLTSEWDPAAGDITYGRSPAGEITSITNNTWTLSGQSGTATLLSNPTNGPKGPISYNFGNGLSQFNSYDSLGRLNGGWVCAGAPSAACSNPNVAQRNGFYVYWSGSRAYASGENYVGQGMTYQYDDFNRLTGMKNSAGQATYSYVYDRYGNRWQQNAQQGGASFSQSFNAVTSNNQLSSGGYTYDAAGNMTYDASGGHHFTYDAEGNILQIDAGQSDSWTFVFDALNHRVRAQYSGGSSEGLFDIAGRSTSSWSGPTTPSESHIFTDSRQIAFRSGDGHTYFNHQNWLNTDRVHTDPSGATAATYTSLPFGDGGSENVSESYAGWDFEHFGDMDVDS